MSGSVVDYLLELLEKKGSDIQYGNEDVTQLEHALQCAELAEQHNKSDAFITAALLHDVGHLLYEDDDPIHEGKDGVHEDLGAPKSSCTPSFPSWIGSSSSYKR